MQIRELSRRVSCVWEGRIVFLGDWLLGSGGEGRGDSDRDAGEIGIKSYDNGESGTRSTEGLLSM